MTSNKQIQWLTLALLLGACDGETLSPDAGPDDGGVPAEDAAVALDPEIASTQPVDGAADVAPSVVLRVRFTTPMDDAGTVALTLEGTPLDTPTLARSADGYELSITPAAPFAPGEVRASLSGFRSRAGAALVGTDAFAFTVADVVAPRVVDATPAEGAVDVDVALSELVFHFDESMDMEHGQLVLAGGPGTLGALSWSSPTEARASVEGLGASLAYAVTLVDVRDRAGNLLDEGAYLGDGALDFATGADTRAPVVVDSDPREGQLDVSLDGVTRVAIHFNEVMNPALGTATLRVNGTETALTVTWDDGDRRALLDVGGLLAVEAAHAIDLAGFEDLAGNAFDAATYLGDGTLDFTTGVDSYVPFVTFATPEEGATEVPTDLSSLVVVFSERMDDSLDTVVIEDQTGRRVTRQVEWGEARTYLTVPLVPGDLLTGFSYTVDLREFADLSGSSIDATHAYLGDGILGFSTVSTRTGEACGDALTIADATTSGTTHTWNLADGAFSLEDNGFSCTPSGAGDDGLIYYRKTTPDVAGGGTALRVRVEGASNDVVMEVFEGTCGTSGAAAEAARRRCLYRQRTWDTVLDVGPGDYFIWVAEYNGSFSGGTVTVEEIAAPTEGESCANPYDTSSSVHAAPATAGDPHVWTIPADSATSLERSVTHDDRLASCVPADRRYGNDAVVRFDKTSATSVLTIRVEAGTGSSLLDVELADACMATEMPRNELGCFESLGDEDRPAAFEATVTGPAGPRFLWLSTPRIGFGSSPYWSPFPGAVVRITEIEPSVPGDSCDNAIAITPGATIPITPDRPYRVDAPSCTSGGVTWYRYTPSQRLSVIQAANGAAIGAIDGATREALSCRTSTLDQRLPVVATPGSPVCIAVASGAATTLSIDERPYTGVVGRVTELHITEPPDAPTSFGSVRFMAATPTDVYVATFNRLYRAPTTGNTSYAFQSPSPSSLIGNDGLMLGDDLLLLSNQSFNATTPVSLLNVLDDPVGAAPVFSTLDTNPAYEPGVALNAVARHGGNLYLATDTPFAGGTTYFFSVPETGGDPVPLGSNDALQSVSGLAVDDTYFYLMGRIGDTSTGTEGIWRLRRDALSDTPFSVYSAGLNYSDNNGAIYVGSSGGTSWLYFRTYLPSPVHFVLDPDTDTPIYLGHLYDLVGASSRSDNGLAYDPSGPTLYLIDTSRTSLGEWMRID